MQTLARAVNDRQRRAAKLLEELAASPGPQVGEAERARLKEHRSHLLDGFYSEFERRFRGEREEIKRRLEVYVPIIRDAAAVTKRAPLLDIGCGRGELLEVMRDNGLAASGIDINAIQVEECRSLGLVAQEGEALARLRGSSEASLGAVTGMHLIEHLLYEDLIALLDESLRVLKPGGIAIFETPNPENLIVGACTFWLDPTHQKPLPPEAMRFLFEARGFAAVEVLPLHPFDESDQLPAGPGAAQLNRLLYGPRDYAIVARKRAET
jgi:2-polyprenyl-3-methyl-5-hydroxy-6-metoxy-1,4-benzoquinol methylase